VKRKFLVYCLSFLTIPLSATEVGDTLVQQSKNSLSVLKLNGGFSFLTSKVEVGDKTYSFQPGWDYMIECELLEESENGVGKGWGLVFKGNKAYIGGENKFNLYYFGINRIWWDSFGKNNRWRWEAAVGGGFCLYKDKTNWDSNGFYRNYLSPSTYIGLGILLKAGCEYRITNHFGLGLEMNNFLHFFFDDALKAQQEKTLLTGFVTSGLTLGLRFYF
jgi:hypothetical protein